jgi:hypothetical protein
MKDAKGHGSNARGGSDDAIARKQLQDRGVAAKDMPARPGDAAASAGLYDIPSHQSGVSQVGQPAGQPNFRMNSYTHTINDPQGNEVGRLSLGKNNGLALDLGEGIKRNSGMAIHDAVAMPAYRAAKSGADSFPAEHIGTELHYMTAKDFSGHTINRTVAGGKKFGHLPGE